MRLGGPGALPRLPPPSYATASNYGIIPLAMETLEPVNEMGVRFIKDIGSRIARVTGDTRETAFLWQRLSVAMQRFHAVCFRQTFCELDSE